LVTVDDTDAVVGALGFVVAVTEAVDVPADAPAALDATIENV
jgi:hypothetical protein